MFPSRRQVGLVAASSPNLGFLSFTLCVCRDLWSHWHVTATVLCPEATEIARPRTRAVLQELRVRKEDRQEMPWLMSMQVCCIVTREQ